MKRPLIALALVASGVFSWWISQRGPEDWTFTWVWQAAELEGTRVEVSSGGRPHKSDFSGLRFQLNDELPVGEPFAITRDEALAKGRRVPWSPDLIADAPRLLQVVVETFGLEPSSLGGRREDQGSHSMDRVISFDLYAGIKRPGPRNSVARAIQLCRLVDGKTLDPVTVLVVREADADEAALCLIRLSAGGPLSDPQGSSQQGVVLQGLGGSYTLDAAQGTTHCSWTSSVRGQTYPLPLPPDFNQHPYLRSENGTMDARAVPEATAWWQPRPADPK